MPDRLTALDASFLRLEGPTHARHVGTVLVFDPPEHGFDVERLLALVADRLSEVPRYRQRLRTFPAGVGRPMWVEDPRFELSYHVRGSALPRPGTREQLEEFVARVCSRPLDRDRPLWEIYLVEALAEGRFAIVTKTHQALVDGTSTIDIGHLLLDDTPEGEPPRPTDPERPREHGELASAARTAVGVLAHPWRLGAVVRGGAADLRGTVTDVLDRSARLTAAVARSATSPSSIGPLDGPAGSARRVATVTTSLADHRLVREGARLSGLADVTITDVVLAAVTGGLRTWLQNRGEPVHSASSVRALVPVGVADRLPLGLVDGARSCSVDLPVGEPGCGLRLERIAYQMRRQTDRGDVVDAASMASLAGFAPSTLHHLGSRLGAAMSRRLGHLVVTNVPGPQEARYAAGARLAATYPVIPLGSGQTLAIGATSYDGRICTGLNADRATLPDLGLLAEGIEAALEELRVVIGERAGQPGQAAQPTRARPRPAGAATARLGAGPFPDEA